MTDVALATGRSVACARCGEPHDPTRCDAHRRGDGRQCGNRRGRGTNHLGYGYCSNHGGSSPNGVVNAQREEDRARETLRRASPDAASVLVSIVKGELEDIPVAERRRAAQDILDRVGVGDRRKEDRPPEVVVVALIERARALRDGRVLDTTASEESSA